MQSHCQTSTIALAVASAAMGLMLASSANAALNVQLSRTLGSDTGGNTVNNGVYPETYTPATVTIPVVNPVTANYDAANTHDAGTTWNSLKCPVTTFTTTTVALTTLYQQALPLVDSFGNATTNTLDVSLTLPPGKTDTIHQTGIKTATGSDGLPPNPTGLMNQNWFDNGVSYVMIFTLHGLTANLPYNLFVYGSGSDVGYGGTFTVPAANQAASYNAAAGAYTTAPNSPTGAKQIFRSVFDATGIDPLPEKGLSWVVLPVTADANGDLTLYVNKDASSGVKGSINGFQVDVVPEPASLSLLGLGALGLIARRRRN